MRKPSSLIIITPLIRQSITNMDCYSLPRSTGKLLIFTLLFTSLTIRADLVSDTESGKQTMSKFMVNLAKFVTWPDGTFASPDTPYKYCIYGKAVI
ncbi:MAG: hypothetical protein ACI9CE_000161 [Flavobacterium sp.]|jgi:hypothetical protein